MEDIELQLLFVVMGEHTVAVKVEEAKYDGTPFLFQIDGMSFGTFMKGNVFLAYSPFPEIRAAIDALEEKPPLPRIELCAATGEMTLYDRDVISDLRILDYHALSQLAGKPLPIWTPTKGEWKQVVKQQLSDGNPTEAGCDVWRYTRRKAYEIIRIADRLARLARST